MNCEAFSYFRGSLQKAMQKFIFRRSGFWLAIFSAFALFGFWRSYFSVLEKGHDFFQHFHGISMSIWCLMLMSQALLIRYKKNQIHRYMGRASFIVFPIMILSTFLITHHSLSDTNSSDMRRLYQLALMFNATVALIAIYTMGIWNRKSPQLHGRYMFCTIFPMFTPITDRIIFNYLKPLVPYAPTIDGGPVVPFYGFLLADLLVIVLAIWDYKKTGRKDAFLIVLGILMLYHISVFTFYRFSFWEGFSKWFLQL